MEFDIGNTDSKTFRRILELESALNKIAALTEFYEGLQLTVEQVAFIHTTAKEAL